MKLNVAPLLMQPVGTRVDFHVDEAPIDPRGENAGLRDADVSAVAVDIEATHTDLGAYLQGDARATVSQECARCLRPIASTVDARFAEQFYARLRVETGAPMPAAPRDAKIIGPDFTVDLTVLIREEVILATPQAPLCRPDCKGLCLVCGMDLNDSPHEHELEVDERWGSLRALRDLHVDRGGANATADQDDGVSH